MDEQAPEPAYSPQYIHMLRTTQTIHLQLSQMADQKASILMGATFLTFTLAIGQARGALPPLPLTILGGFAFVSAVLAMLVVLPSAGKRRNAKPAPLNLLFFGSFTQLPEAEFVTGLRNAAQSDRTILELMARDIYQNGQVLRRKKYRMLGWAYRVFLAGLVASFAAFLLDVARPYLG
ncbi:Pycsar system effector family protein [Sphingomonas sp.]|uniref:Pycsar system effector family protein n=1 Tax=Sphingomonas sp. TaxID=28214 RepID=UPI001B285BDB|nr:Pycsar system effector family protein [Sphingomonas sp.]MBO9714292.1 hypothetical protein [Sphingomonas sp.]